MRRAFFYVEPETVAAEADVPLAIPPQIPDNVFFMLIILVPVYDQLNEVILCQSRTDIEYGRVK